MVHCVECLLMGCRLGELTLIHARSSLVKAKIRLVQEPVWRGIAGASKDVIFSCNSIILLLEMVSIISGPLIE